MSAAFEVLGFYELPTEDQPPQEIWHSSERMKEWFDGVKQRRTDGASGLDPIDGPEADDMETNAEAAELKRSLGIA